MNLLVSAAKQSDHTGKAEKSPYLARARRTLLERKLRSSSGANLREEHRVEEQIHLNRKKRRSTQYLMLHWNVKVLAKELKLPVAVTTQRCSAHLQKEKRHLLTHVTALGRGNWPLPHCKRGVRNCSSRFWRGSDQKHGAIRGQVFGPSILDPRCDFGIKPPV